MNEPYYPPLSILTEEQKNKYTSDLKELELYFKREFNFPIYLMYGTLLGAIRDKDYIPHDTDVDVGYLSSFNKEEDVLAERLELINKLEDNKILRWRKTSGIKIKFNDNDFDVWTSWINENNKYTIIPLSDLGEKDVIVPFKTITFRGIEFSVPQKSEELLDKIYINWKVPLTEKYFKPNRKFRLPT